MTMLNPFDPKQTPHSFAAYEYAANPPHACIKLKQTCQRHLSDLEQPDSMWVYDPALADRAVNFIQLLPHVSGKWATKKELLKLEPWQVFIVTSLFGWVHADTGLRRFNRSYIKISRKNGKTCLAAGIALYHFLATNEHGAEVFNGASTERQAHILFKMARQMVLKTPALMARYNMRVNASSLVTTDTAGKFEPVIGKPGDGASPSCAIVDEFHEHPTSDQYDTFKTGAGARSEPLLLVITTAGTNIASPCYELETSAGQVLSKIIVDDNLFVCMYEIDPEDNWLDFDCLRKANPNMGVSISEEYLKQQHTIAINNPAQANIFKIKHANIWVNSKAAWMSELAWERCADATLKIEDFTQDDMIGGLDLSSKIDLTAFVQVFVRNVEGRKHFYVFSKFYLPEETIIASQNHMYASWAAEGYLTQIPGAEIDQSWVLEYAKQLNTTHKIREIAYDRAKAGYLIEQFEANKILAVECRQVVMTISPMMKEVEAAIASGRLHHDGNPMLKWCMLNVTCKEDIKGNVYPNRAQRHSKIDGAVALIMAVGRASVELVVEETASIYNTRPIRFLG